MPSGAWAGWDSGAVVGEAPDVDPDYSRGVAVPPQPDQVTTDSPDWADDLAAILDTAAAERLARVTREREIKKEFQRDHKRRRDWGLVRRHETKLERLRKMAGTGSIHFFYFPHRNGLGMPVVLEYPPGTWLPRVGDTVIRGDVDGSARYLVNDVSGCYMDDILTHFSVFLFHQPDKPHPAPKGL